MVRLLWVITVVVFLWELIWSYIRYRRRGLLYKQAVERSRMVDRPLLVIGRPTASTAQLLFGGANYGCGDLVVDILPAEGCKHVQSDILEFLKQAESGSYVVFISCVLEYPNYTREQVRELQDNLQRVTTTEDNLFLCSIEPWTLTGFFYIDPGFNLYRNSRLILDNYHWVELRGENENEKVDPSTSYQQMDNSNEDTNQP